jgi:RNA polymerase sigma-70 factor (ECF subfamily)
MPPTFGAELVALLPRLRRYALTLSRSSASADDLVQAACEKALAHAARFEPGSRLDAWVFRILRNVWIDGLRQRRRQAPAEAMESGEDIVGDTGEDAALSRLTLQEVKRRIQGLPAEQREVLLLVCVEDMSYREVAAVLDVPIGTVMSRLARARRRLVDVSEAA